MESIIAESSQILSLQSVASIIAEFSCRAREKAARSKQKGTAALPFQTPLSGKVNCGALSVITLWHFCLIRR